MKIQNSADFSQSIRNYLSKSGLSRKELADKTGCSKHMIMDWLRYGLKTAQKRDEIIKKYPWIFLDNLSSDPTVRAEELTLATLPVSPPKVLTNPVNEVQVLMKIELGRHGIVVLSDILQWFIDASADERNRFREELGGIWKNFLELTRAMTGERALELALQERRVKSGINHD